MLSLLEIVDFVAKSLLVCKCVILMQPFIANTQAAPVPCTGHAMRWCLRRDKPLGTRPDEQLRHVQTSV